MRTEKSILNMLSEVIPFLIMGILGFIKIRVFWKYLGQDYYGFSQLFNQIFNYLNLAEAGFGMAIVYALYAPVAEENKEKINSILSGAKIIFKRIGFLVIGVGIVLSFFMDYFIKNNPISPIYTQVLFIIYLLTSAGNYFIYAPRFLLQADQNRYKTNGVNNTMRVLQILVEIIMLMLGANLMMIFIWYFIVMIIANVIINKIAYTQYPWIDLDQKPDLSTATNTKHVFLHKIGNIISLNTDNIVLSAVVGIGTVAVYASYNYIIQFINNITTKIVNSTQESFGNFFVLEDKERGISTYWEMSSFSFFMGSVFLSVTYLSINDFIRLWVGENMVVSQFTVLLFCIVLFTRIVRETNMVIVNGVGAFKETKWQSLFEGIINLTLSIILARRYAIDGVLGATIIGYSLTGFWFVPNYIFKYVFQRKVRDYYLSYGFNVVVLVAIQMILQKIITHTNLYQGTTNLLIWALKTSILTIVVSLIYFAIYYLVYKPFRQFIDRFIRLLKIRRGKT